MQKDGVSIKFAKYISGANVVSLWLKNYSCKQTQNFREDMVQFFFFFLISWYGSILNRNNVNK